MGQWTLCVVENSCYSVVKLLCNKVVFINNATDHIIAIDRDTIYFNGAREAYHSRACLLPHTSNTQITRAITQSRNLDEIEG